MASNLPPGCSNRDIEHHFACPPCDVCGLDPEGGCVCLPCPVCDDVGDAVCYQELSVHNHGIRMTPDQHRLYEEKMQRLQEELRRDVELDRAYEEMQDKESKR